MPGRSKFAVMESQETVLRMIRNGAPTRKEAAKQAGVSENAVDKWFTKDTLGWRKRVQDAWRRQSFGPSEPVPDFTTFRKQAFGHDTPSHHAETVAALEEHPFNLTLWPPEHGKTTLTEEYIVWRIAQDRNVRVIIVSKAQVVARKRLYRIQKFLTDEAFYTRNDLVSVPATWGPFKPTDSSMTWSKDMFYVSGIDSAERDPTVEALGVGNQIQGARADLIILDDIATLKNQLTENEREKILDWISQEVITRLPPDGGKLWVIGTRVSEYDIYSSMLEGDWADTFHSLVRPAILDEEKQETLWPERWNYEALVRRRSVIKPRSWALTYQQQATGLPDAPFSQDIIDSIKDDTFAVGQKSTDLEVFIGCDPALTETSAIVVVGYDRKNGMRYLLDVVARHGLKYPEKLHELLVDTCAHYRARELRVEKNAMQGFFTRDRGLGAAMSAIGTRLVEQYTGLHNKFDPDWGVGSVASQFAAGRYRIPWLPPSPQRLQPFLAELSAWRPEVGKRQRQDMVMALWFAELSVRENEKIAPGEQKPLAVPAWIERKSIARERTNHVPPWMRSKYAGIR